MPNILITNDDGVRAPGLLALKQALDGLGTVYVLAPERNWSAAGHARTMHDPLRINSVRLEDGSEAFATSGGPADCVALALLGALDVPIDLVVSGINNGHNMGNDTNYSGTVACAREATIFGIPGIAVSTALEPLAKCDLGAARRLAGVVGAMVAAQVLEHGLPKGTMLNVNVPAVPPSQLQGIEVTRLGVRTYADELVRREDPYGRPYYWLYGALPTDVADDGTDVGAVANDRVSITPIGLDMTEHIVQAQLRHRTFDTLQVRASADDVRTPVGGVEARHGL